VREKDLSLTFPLFPVFAEPGQTQGRMEYWETLLSELYALQTDLLVAITLNWQPRAFS
jgi:hypothetical protein